MVITRQGLLLHLKRLGHLAKRFFQPNKLQILIWIRSRAEINAVISQSRPERLKNLANGHRQLPKQLSPNFVAVWDDLPPAAHHL